MSRKGITVGGIEIFWRISWKKGNINKHVNRNGMYTYLSCDDNR